MEAVLPPSQMVFFPMMLVIPVVLMLVENSSLSKIWIIFPTHDGREGGRPKGCRKQTLGKQSSS